MKVDRLERLIRLGELRCENKISQEKVAELLGVTRPQYTLYETGRREIPIKYLIILANFYGVSIDYIVGETNIRNRN